MAYKLISAMELKQSLDTGGGLSVVDALVPEHYEEMHIPGAKQVCVYEYDFMDQMEKLFSDKSTPLVLYGSSPRTHTAFSAAEKLERAGYKDISVLAGGLEGWREAGYKLEGSKSGHPDLWLGRFLPPEGEFAALPQESGISWTGRNHNGKHFGSVQLTEGLCRFSGGKLNGSFTVDMTSIKDQSLDGNELQPVLETHLKSDDFWFTSLFPQARFKLENAVPLKEQSLSIPTYEIRGMLELRGVKRPFSFPASFNLLDDGRLAVEAHFDLDRTLWGAIYGSTRFFEHLGYHMVFDMVSLDLRLVMEPKQ